MRQTSKIDPPKKNKKVNLIKIFVLWTIPLRTKKTTHRIVKIFMVNISTKDFYLNYIKYSFNLALKSQILNGQRFGQIFI